MTDNIIVDKIIATLGLTGPAAEAKRSELNNLSYDELIQTLSNAEKFKLTDLGSFSSLNGSPRIQNPDDASWGLSIGKNEPTEIPLRAADTPSSKKKFSAAEQRDLDKFLGDFLYDSAQQALDTMTTYNNSVGIFSFDSLIDLNKIL